MKLLASNCDGTLYYGQSILESDQESIQAWQEQGNLYAIATGRAYKPVKEILDSYGIHPDYYITNCGAMIYNRDGKKLQTNYMDYLTSIDLIYIAKETESCASYLVDDGRDQYRIVVHPEANDPRFKDVQPTLSEEEIMDLGSYVSVTLSMTDEDAATEFAQELSYFFADNTDISAFANGTCIDIVRNGISKGTGLEFVSEFSNIDEEDVYAIGCTYTDIPMFDVATKKIRLAGSPEEVVEATDTEVVTLTQMFKEME